MRKGEADALSPLVEMLFRPMADKLMGVAAEGIRCGELIRVEPSQMIYATVGPNVFYFLSAPMMRLIGEMNVLDPTALAFRRRAAVEFLAQAIFIDRARGARLAVQVLADTPMPTVSALPKPEVQTGVSPSPRWLQSNIEVGQTSASEVRKK
jgi:TetR/AcrR family transcriptional regulator